MLEIRIEDLRQLEEAAMRFVETARPGRVYAFRAPMGAGKTTFISEVCRLLGSDDEPSSPTFSIVNEYDTEKWGKIFHLDCYRLNSEEEAFDIGIEDYFAGGDTCFVEWPEKIESLLPPDAVDVEIRVDPNGSTRCLTLHFDS